MKSNIPSHVSRRRFLARAFLAAGGALALTPIGEAQRLAASSANQTKPDASGVSPERRVRELGLELPPITTPVATFVPAVQVGDMLYVSGHVSIDAKGQRITGKVGKDVDLEAARAAAMRVGLSVLSCVRATLGSLDRVQRIVKTLGMVNCTTEFTQQPQVINGFSDLMVDVFGPERGKGARSAVGMNALPGNAVVEIEVIFQVRP